MRKLIMLLPLLALLCGCAPVPAVPAETVPAVTETNAAPAEPAAQEVSCISDPGHLLTQEENAQLSAAIEELSARQMIRAALVLTQDLGGSTPEAYAAAQYAAMCGAGNDGFLVLVNDATGQDLIYTEGACRNAMTDTALPIAQATPALVEGRFKDAYIILRGACADDDELISPKSGANPAVLAALSYHGGKALERKIALLVAVVVVDQLQSVHIYERDQERRAVLLALAEEYIRLPNEAVAVENAAEGIDDVESVQLLDNAVEAEQLADILDRVADIHHERMAQQAFYGEIPVCDHIVAQASLTEMQGQKIADISAASQRLRLHIGAEKADRRPDLALIPDKRSAHSLGVAVNLVLVSGPATPLLVEGAVPLRAKANAAALTIQLPDKPADNADILLSSLGLCQLTGHAVEERDVCPAAVYELIGALFVELHIVSKNAPTAAAFGEDRLCLQHDLLLRLTAFNKSKKCLAGLISGHIQRTQNSCQRRAVMAGVVCIVEAGDDDVLRHSIAVSFQLSYD